MRYTNLEAVQLLLSSMDSDEVNSVADTVESNQVLLLLKSVYYDICSELNLSEHNSLFELNASGDIGQPTLMTIPSNVTRVDWVEYDVREDGDEFADWQKIDFVELDEFLTRQNALRNDTENTDEIEFTLNSETFTTMYYDDRRPYCYTSVDDYTLLFDGFNSSLESTLVKAKTRCSGTLIPAFSMTDNFVPDFNPQQFSYYINRAKVRAFAELKQAANQEAGREARNQKIILQKRKRTAENVPEVLRVGARYGRIAPMNAPYKIPNYLRQGD